MKRKLILISLISLLAFGTVGCTADADEKGISKIVIKSFTGEDIEIIEGDNLAIYRLNDNYIRIEDNGNVLGEYMNVTLIIK